MVIKRSIGGAWYNIRLTPDELAEAYYEQQENFDVEDIVSYTEAFDKKELDILVGCDYKTILDHKDEMARRMRKYLDKYDMSFATAREEAIRDVASECKEKVTA